MTRKTLGRKAAVIAALLAVMVLAACDTQPATDVTNDGATLNSKGACSGGGYGGTNQYQLRNATANGGWADVGPRYRFDCTGATGEVALNAFHPTGLAPTTTYQFRLVTRLDNGQVNIWDANGTNGGTAYDSFRTKSDRDWANACEQNPGLPDCSQLTTTDNEGSEGGPVTTECLNGATACASASQKKCKGRNGNPLTNVYREYWNFIKTREAKVETDWCWKDGKVIERHSVPSALVTAFGAALQGQFVNHDDNRTGWKYSACTADQSSCLTRYQATFSCCYDDETPVNIYNKAICIGTRICAYACNETGAFHSRNIIYGSCP